MIDITQYGDIWAMEPDRALSLLAYIKTIGPDIPRLHSEAFSEHIKAVHAVQPSNVGTAVNKSGSVRAIEISGTMMKKVSSFSDGTSTVAVRRQIENAANDADVNAIILHIDSPGGTVSGTQDLAQEVAKANKIKPVFAYIEDMGASAAYWAASQAGKVYAANKTTLIGSIGAFFGIYDISKWAEANGIKPILFTTGQFKTIFPGQEVSKEQIDYLQSRVNQMQEQFNGAVTAGRKMTAAELKAVTDGKVYIAEEAVQFRLADGIKTFNEVVAEAEAASNPGNRVSGKAAAMPRDNMATVPALKAALPGASAEFIVSQIEREATVPEAVTAFAAFEVDRLTKFKADLDDRKAKLDDREKAIVEREEKIKTREEAVQKIEGGARPLPQSGGEGGGSPGTANGKIGAAEAQVRELTKQRMKDNPKESEATARLAVLRENSQLRNDLITEANANRQRLPDLMIG
jgi:signal peptide peptidase SppA